MDKDEKYILDELAYSAGRPTWFEISGNLAIKLQEMMTRKDAEIDRLRNGFVWLDDTIEGHLLFDPENKIAQEMKRKICFILSDGGE